MNPLENSWFEVIDEPKPIIYSEDDSPVTQSDTDDDVFVIGNVTTDSGSPDTTVGSVVESSTKSASAHPGAGIISDFKLNKLVSKFQKCRQNTNTIVSDFIVSQKARFNSLSYNTKLITCITLLLTSILAGQSYYFNRRISCLQSVFPKPASQTKYYMAQTEYITKTMNPVIQYTEHVCAPGQDSDNPFVTVSHDELLTIDADHVIVIKWPSFVKSSYSYIKNSLADGLHASKFALRFSGDASKNAFAATFDKIKKKRSFDFRKLFNRNQINKDLLYMCTNLKNGMKLAGEGSSKALTIAGYTLGHAMKSAAVTTKSLGDRAFRGLTFSTGKTFNKVKSISTFTWPVMKDAFQIAARESSNTVRSTSSALNRFFSLYGEALQNASDSILKTFNLVSRDSISTIGHFFSEKYHLWNAKVTVCEQGFFTKYCRQREKTFYERLSSVL